MGGQLQPLLRNLCFDSGWNYAVFWKLKHRARMMLTCEDAYYVGNESTDRKWFNSTPNDPLGLVVAKMSYEVYSLGEGIVGQVAVSGKHSWIYSDQTVSESSSSSEYFGPLQSQFSVGIKTIAVMAVVPHGVVQLGSLHKIAEDLKLVEHIRNAFCEWLDSRSKTESYCLSDDSTVLDLKSTSHDEEVNLWSLLYSPLRDSTEQASGLSNKASKANVATGADISYPSSSRNILTGLIEIEATESLNDGQYGERNDSKDVVKGSMGMSKSAGIGKSSLSNSDKSQMVDDIAIRDQDPELSDLRRYNEFGNLEPPIKSSCVGMQILPFGFGSGYELYEALGPSFRKQIDCVWHPGKSDSDMAIDISEGIGSCSLMPESSDAHLLDAVVAKVSGKVNDAAASEKSCRKTRGSLPATEKTICSSSSIATVSSAGYSFEKGASSSLNSATTCGAESFKGFSSPSSSRGSDYFGRLVKTNKKRSRPGESSRPRPRDRQLIQDRIKELRELIPSGSKCSIDSLLEQTIKHMLFLQSVTNHAEKLSKSSASKVHGDFPVPSRVRAGRWRWETMARNSSRSSSKI
ncbi:transcription factor EMB1444-like isoform X2 [Andrographis paniculata]|uniref:transcription factor EMB1444-like isoform X2 n=1 Tax=Andrographis paniculata TaxID=175694 RepID=UPI0021E82FBA|nr:transcription factor EMB1444-like isoform X2 [Andrographis paniculata]